MGPIGCIEMLVTNYSLHCITSQKSENLIYSAAKAPGITDGSEILIINIRVVFLIQGYLCSVYNRCEDLRYKHAYVNCIMEGAPPQNRGIMEAGYEAFEGFKQFRD